MAKWRKRLWAGCAGALLVAGAALLLRDAMRGGAEAERKAAYDGRALPMNGIKYDPPVQLTTVAVVGPNVTFKNGETIEHNVHTRWALDRLGIDIRYLWSTMAEQRAFETKLRQTLARSEPLPDIVNVSGSFAQELIDSGRFRRVDDLFERYASERWKEAAAESAGDMLPYTRGGRLYALPVYDYAGMSDPVLWIRQDWLDRLRLSAPRNAAELERVMEAFTNGDPDGNGANDTVALALSLKDMFPSLTYRALPWVRNDWVFGMYGDALPAVWGRNAEGNIEYGSIDPGMKPALARLSEWMARGYLSRDAGIHNSLNASELFTSGKAGMIAGPTWMYAWPLRDTEKQVTGAKVAPYPLPVGDRGTTRIGGMLNHSNVMLISKEMAHPEIYFTYMNYLYEQFADPPPGGEFAYGFAEGYDYVLEGGKAAKEAAKFQDGIVVKPSAYTLTGNAARIPSLQMKTYLKLIAGQPMKTPYEQFMAAIATPQEMQAVRYVSGQKEMQAGNLYMGPATELMQERQEALKNMENDTFQKIIYGTYDIGKFDEFVTRWRESGGDRITEEVEAWYGENVRAH
ncbi:extracellular solute-binding protein [Paenibacillus cymbidii]|uniref:extracellular solute-binding protein n=1 Tax=Paenibacillus cymbidii TaxID=1639034 RepID=UPI001436CB46|nr:extracellular solute-binding protein [Paenibacillus cymbidii]